MTEVIYVEGPDGSGKTTLIKKLEARFKAEGKRVYVTREPGGEHFTPVRNLLGDRNDVVCEPARRALFFANHIQVLHEVQEVVDDYDYIIIDRMSFVSDYVYGCALNDRPYGSKRMMNDFSDMSEYIYKVFFKKLFARCSVRILFIDISDALLISRLSNREDAGDLLDGKSMSFKLEVNHAYKKVIRRVIKQGVVPVTKFNPADCKLGELVECIKNTKGGRLRW